MEQEQQPQRGSSYLIETEDGFLVRVPEEKMEAWQRADHKAPLTPAEERAIEMILDSLYGPKP